MPPAVLRPFSSSDYEAVVSFINRADPAFPFTVEAFRQMDTNRAAHCGFARLVAKQNKQIVGVGQIDQRADQFHPRRFLMYLWVLPPDWQSGGVASLLYDALMADGHKRGVEAVRGFAREDAPDVVRFWQERGYHETMRDGGAFLPLADFDPARWEWDEVRFAQNDGIRLLSFAELSNDPDRDQKLHELFNAILADVPPLGERTPVDFETFVRLRLERIGFLPDALFVAVAPTGDYFGVHQLLTPPSGASDVLATGLTGVLTSWRRKGVALALKVRGLRYAHEKSGIQTVRTWNASDNLPVLQLNKRLGFVREPWRIHFLKTF